MTTDPTNRSTLGRDEIAAIRAHLEAVPEMVRSVDDFVIHDVVCTETIQALKETINSVAELRVARIRGRVGSGWSRTMIAKVLGLNRSRVDQLVNR